MSFSIDDSAYPLLVSVWRGESSVDDIHAYAARMNAYVSRALAEGSSLAVVSDASAVTATSPAVKKAIAQLEPSPSVIVGTWLISDSALMRGVMAALRWLNPALATVRMVRTHERALHEARAALEAAR